MTESDDMDLFAPWHECKRVGLDGEIDRHIKDKRFSDSVDNYREFLLNSVFDVPEVRPLPDAWVDFCKTSGYNMADSVAKSAVGWLCAVHGACHSWKKHRTSCPKVSDRSSPPSFFAFNNACVRHFYVCVWLCGLV